MDKPIYIFHHCPKAGGTTFRRLFERISNHYSVWNNSEDKDPYDIIEECRKNEIGIVSSHWNFHPWRMPVIPNDCKRFTILRDPVGLFWSAFNFFGRPGRVKTDRAMDYRRREQFRFLRHLKSNPDKYLSEVSKGHHAYPDGEYTSLLGAKWHAVFLLEDLNKDPRYLWQFLNKDSVKIKRANKGQHKTRQLSDTERKILRMRFSAEYEAIQILIKNTPRP